MGRQRGTNSMGRGRLDRGVLLLGSALLALACALLAAFASSPAGAAPTPIPVWQLTLVHGPTNVPIQPPVNQVTTITISGGEHPGAPPNEGRWKLEWENLEGKEGHTKLLQADATAAEVKAALEAVKIIGPGNVEVTGGPEGKEGELGWKYRITFVGELAGQELEPLA
ncbi:MAG TPA: hypothetical protein VGD00_11395, partial [Solirubrobacteraceae bacterium]